MIPSIGRVVHYVSFGTPKGEFLPACRAAIVTEVDPSDPTRIGLCAINPTGIFFRSLADGGCKLAETGVAYEAAGGSWHWPERV